MITCARCSKDNQDHYKFCLGCGAKLEAPGAGAPARGTGDRDAIETAKTAPPQPGMIQPRQAIPTGGAALTAVASPGLAPAPRSSPTPSPLAIVPAPVAAPAPLVAPVSVAAPLSVAAPVSVAAPLSVAAPVSVAAPLSVAAPASAAALPTVECPDCGKAVIVGYAFCGSCGHRMKPAPAAAAAPAAGVPRTMFMASPPQSKTAPRGHLTLIRPDGTEGGLHPLHDGENLIGRGQGSLFDADPYLSPRHAEFVLNDEGLVVQDLRSLNGLFVKLTQEEKLDSGDVFRIGQELLRFDVIAPPAPLEDGTEIIGTPNPGYWGRISVVVGRESDGPAFPLFDESVVLGRERGDILFPEDGYVSGSHAQVTLRDGQVYLSDLGSSNGTFFRIRESKALPAGSLILMGQQLFRASYR